MEKKYLIEKFMQAYPFVEKIEFDKEKCYLVGMLPEGFKVEIMPSHRNLFVIRFKDFKFFAKKELEQFFRLNIQNDNCKFEINSESIYVYANSKSEDPNNVLEIFNQIKALIDFTIKNILNQIS